MLQLPHTIPPTHLPNAGLNVVLVSRTKAKLDAAAAEIAAATGVQTRAVVADFSSADQVSTPIRRLNSK